MAETFARGSGPGGQHRNVTASAVELVADLNALEGPGAARARAVLGEEVRVRSDDSRSQWRNRSIARERLAALIDEASVPIAPRRPTRPSRTRPPAPPRRQGQGRGSQARPGLASGRRRVSAFPPGFLAAERASPDAPPAARNPDTNAEDGARPGRYRPRMGGDGPGTATTAGVVERLTAAARSLLSGRRVILAHMPVAGAGPLVGQFDALGAERSFVLGPFVGTGELPDPATTDWYSLDIEAADPIDVFRQFERAMAEPPDDLVAALDAFDPGRDALVLVMPFDATTSVAGRPAFGARRPAWVALEDKTTNDALFERAGVACAPSEIVAAADRPALGAAAARIDRGAGTVWSGDAREGFNGGGVLVRHVTGPDRATAVAGLMAAHCDRVRVAPFLDGIPCSIHGVVADDGIAVFRPMEMVVLRTPDTQFRYAGVASYWDPPVAARDEMRAAARHVGALLHDEVGFAGSYGIDGVLTADGFRPTELNPRMGGGLSVVARAVPDIPLFPLHWIAAAGRPLGVTAHELEETLTAAADTRRGGGGWVFVSRTFTETSTYRVVVEDGVCRSAADGEMADAEVTIGPGAEGGFVRCILEPDRTPVGPSVARACARSSPGPTPSSTCSWVR